MSIVQNGSSIQHVCNLFHSLKFNCAIQRTIACSEESLVRVKEQYGKVTYHLNNIVFAIERNIGVLSYCTICLHVHSTTVFALKCTYCNDTVHGKPKQTVHVQFTLEYVLWPGILACRTASIGTRQHTFRQ